MGLRTASSICLVVLCLVALGCGGSAPPDLRPRPPDPAGGIAAASGSAPTATAATASASTSAAESEEPAAPIPMYEVVRIHSLLDVTATDEGHIEVRLGTDPGGGATGRFR